MRPKVTCSKGHKWYQDVAGYENCPVCGEAPMPSNLERQILNDWKPPKDHKCRIIDTEDGIAVICSRG